MPPARGRTVLLTDEDSAAMLASTPCIAVALLDCIAIPTPRPNNKKAQMTPIKLFGTYASVTNPAAATTNPVLKLSHGGTFTRSEERRVGKKLRSRRGRIPTT